MVVYNYKCEECDFSFEEEMRMTDDPYMECPLCKKPARRLIMGGCGVVFKGSGWAKDNYNKGK